jgi:serine/threonine protein kinase
MLQRDRSQSPTEFVVIKLACTCGMTLKVADGSAGAMVKCPGCGTISIVPVKVAAVTGNWESSAPPGADSQAALGDAASTAGEIAQEATAAPAGAASDQGTCDHDPGGPPQAPCETWSLGGYRILRELGHGGMGTVYEAEDVKLERRVALKVMKPEIAKHQQQRDRFLREARTAAKVKSDFICAIYQVGEDNGVPFIAMPLLMGESLKAHLHEDLLLADDEVVRIGKEVAQGLSAAHEAGLIHRDIKPANIWLETQRSGPPRAILLDFGLARAKVDDVQITQSGAILGTPAYMSPEQGRGDKNVDARTDLFSLGCVLYLLGTGELPFQGDTTMAVLTALATHDPTPPHMIFATIPKPLSRLIMRLLEKDPDDRPQLATSVVEKLVQIENDLPKRTREGAPRKVKPPPPLPARSARSTTQMPRSGGRTAIKTMEMPRDAAPSAVSRKTYYALFGLIAVGLLGSVLALAGGLYYFVFAGGKGPDPKTVAEENKAPPVVEDKQQPDPGAEPTGAVPEGWVVLKLPEANCTGAMPEQPQVSGEMGGGTQRIVTRPDGRMLVLMTRPIAPAQIALGGGSDRWLHDQINANKAGLSIQVTAESQGRLQAQFSAGSELSLGQYKGRETRCTKKAVNPNTPYSGYTFVLAQGSVKIIRVIPDSPSGKAGLKANDIVYEAGGREITDIKIMTDSSHQVGDELLLKVKRGEEKLELKVTLAAVPAAGLEVIYMRDYLIGNTYLQVAVHGEADPPAPETVAFFNSLKLGN